MSSHAATRIELREGRDSQRKGRWDKDFGKEHSDSKGVLGLRRDCAQWQLIVERRV